MTDYLMLNRDGTLMLTADGRLRVQSDDEGPIGLIPPSRLCCPCPPPPSPPWAFGTCANLTTRRAVLTTPNIDYWWYMTSFTPGTSLCGRVDVPPIQNFTAIAPRMDLAIGSVTTDNVHPVTGEFGNVFNDYSFRDLDDALNCRRPPHAYTTLPWAGISFRPSETISRCPPAWESFIESAGCGLGTEFRDDPVAFNEPGVGVIVVTQPTMWVYGSDILILCDTPGTNQKRHFDFNTYGTPRLLAVEAFIPARTGVTTFCRQYRQDPTGPVIENATCPPFVVSQG